MDIGNMKHMNSIEDIEEDMKILEGIIKGDEDCINAIYSQMKVKKDNDEDIQYYKKEIQSIKNIVDNYLKEKARADKLEKEYSAMLTELDENELEFDIDCDWIALQKMLDESEKSNEYISYKNEKWIKEKYCIPIQKVKDKIEELKKKVEELTDDKGYWGGSDLLEQIKVLQELLEKEK